MSRHELTQYIPALKKAKVIAVDTETAGLEPYADSIRLIQLAASGLPVFIIDCFAFLPEGIDIIKDILESHAVKVFQNAKFDLQFLLGLGVYPAPVFDTMLAGELLRSSGGPSRVNLTALARHLP
ncbi:MAG: hypothetical protein FWE91_11505 [Defluviitaleaceae bacterium]|nr:hypothetical protein [Defluviitaleaceae bacterium]MCL2836203.1 hypothetical protein [Defluviitaleaceae bacterium]